MSERGPVRTDRPTVLVRMADAGDVYVSWRWLGDDPASGVTALPGTEIDRVVGELAAALPDPNIPGGLERSLTTAALATADSEYLLARDLSRALLPHDLADQLYSLHRQG
ncbi:MAG: hypothetical protein HOQ44_23910, partial [Nocardia sp.]|nr:hypothetical protein [Nocardia sp.]